MFLHPRASYGELFQLFSPAGEGITEKFSMCAVQYVKELKNGYYGRRAMAKLDPANSLSIIIDGSDNGEYGFPYFYVKTKETSKGFKMKTKLIGALVHGRQLNVFTLPWNTFTGSSVVECHLPNVSWGTGGDWLGICGSLD